MGMEETVRKFTAPPGAPVEGEWEGVAAQSEMKIPAWRKAHIDARV